MFLISCDVFGQSLVLSRALALQGQVVQRSLEEKLAAKTERVHELEKALATLRRQRETDATVKKYLEARNQELEKFERAMSTRDAAFAESAKEVVEKYHWVTRGLGVEVEPPAETDPAGFAAWLLAEVGASMDILLTLVISRPPLPSAP